MNTRLFQPCFSAAWFLPLQLLLTLPAVVQAQFNFTTNNGAITITAYTGPGGDVAIPSTTNDYAVVSIGNSAFKRKSRQQNLWVDSGSGSRPNV